MSTRQRMSRPGASNGANSAAEPADGGGAPSGSLPVVLVLQGGGALGAYQAGVYEALHEAGMEPDWIIGTSIGAVNAALIAGNAAERRVERLHAFWARVAHKGFSALWPGPPSLPTLWTNWSAMSQGLPGFFAPFPPAWLSPLLQLDEVTTGYYQTQALRETLTGLVDVDRLGGGAPRLTVGAVNVRSGEMRYFDSREERLGLHHVMASSALPPAFPPVQVDDDLYRDGGIFSNTPVEAVFDDTPRRSALIFAVQLWHAAGVAPRAMGQVSARQKDIRFASRMNSHVQRQAQIHRLRHVVRELTDARRAIAQQAWLAPVATTEGLVVHDLRPSMP